MTPQERQLVADLFARLASLENAPRDADAVRAINEGLERAPNALYALVQTVLLQDEALKRADTRIRELEGGQPPREQGGFLDSMRENMSGQRDAPRGSVPNAGAGAGYPPDSRWGTQGQQYQPQPGQPSGQAWQPQASQGQPQQGGGGSFLGTAAAAAAGVVGGSLLMNSISSLFGQRGGGSAFANPAAGGSSSPNPWDNSAGSDLSREAGLNDVGGRSGDDRRAAFDSGNDDQGYNDDQGDDDGNDDDFGDDDMGGDFGDDFSSDV
jgi:uncharacterized protein